MSLVPFKVTNFNENLDELITTQFSDKDVFRRFLRLIKTECDVIIEEERALIQQRDIDSAIGAQLDIIGNIVGQERVVISGDLYPFFGYKDALAANSFGTVYNKTIGGNWWSLGTKIGGDVTLNDSQYRLLIKAKIIKNNASGLNEDYVKFGNFVLDANVNFENDSGGSSNTTVLIGRRMTMFEKALLSYVFEGVDYNYTYSPKPLGVGVIAEEYDAAGTLGFIGTPGAKGMVSLSFPFNGGVFADAYF